MAKAVGSNFVGRCYAPARRGGGGEIAEAVSMPAPEQRPQQAVQLIDAGFLRRRQFRQVFDDTQQVGSADDPNHLAILHDRQSLSAM